MILVRHTLSLCPICYKEISAQITIDEAGALMAKRCATHGAFSSRVERDPLYYLYAANLKAKTIYGGHFVDVTRTCQLRCDPCYYRLEKRDPESMFSIGEIVNECVVNIDRAPFILTGGEPTLHPQLVEVITEVKKVGQVELLSNGIKLADPEYFNEVISLITDTRGISHLNLSIHHRETDKWQTVIELARKERVTIESALIVVQSRKDFWAAIELCRSMADVVQTFRIKAASQLWNAAAPDDKIFVSDMIKWLEASGQPVGYVAPDYNKPCFFNVMFAGMHLMLVSWYDVTNVDLLEIDCPPTYRARNGQVVNFVTAALINEGMERANVRAEQVAVIPEAVPA